MKSFPFGAILLLIFITLKLCHVIAWSWWWVMSPIWVTIIFVFSAILVSALIQYKRGNLK